MVRHPRGSYTAYPLTSLEVTTQENKSIHSTLPSIRKSASKAVLSRMQLTLHASCPTPHGASRLAQAMSAWSMETRRAPSRHRRDARVYGHTTTVVHDNEYAPPPSPPQKEPLSGWLKRPTDGTTDRTQVDDSCKCPAARVRSSRQPY